MEFSLAGSTQNNVYYLQNLRPNTEYFIRCRAIIKKNKKTGWSQPVLLKTLKQFVFIQQMFKSNKSVLGYNIKIRNQIQNYKIPSKFKQFGIDNINILLFGMSKSGKSAFLNSIETTMQNKYVELHNTMSYKNIVTRRL